MSITTPAEAASSPQHPPEANKRADEIPVPTPIPVQVPIGIAIFAAIFGYLATRRVQQKSRLAAAAREFRAVVSKAIHDLEALDLSVGINAVYEWAVRQHDTIALAIDAYVQMLPATRRIALGRDWQRHCHGTDARGEPEAPDRAGMTEEQHRYLHCVSYEEPEHTKQRMKFALANLLKHAGDT